MNTLKVRELHSPDELRAHAVEWKLNTVAEHCGREIVLQIRK